MWYFLSLEFNVMDHDFIYSFTSISVCAFDIITDFCTNTGTQMTEVLVILMIDSENHTFVKVFE